jgi:hypothetical protein
MPQLKKEKLEAGRAVRNAIVGAGAGARKDKVANKRKHDAVRHRAMAAKRMAAFNQRRAAEEAKAAAAVAAAAAAAAE